MLSIIEVFTVSTTDVIENRTILKHIDPILHLWPYCKSGVIEMLGDDVVGPMDILSLEIG